MFVAQAKKLTSVGLLRGFGIVLLAGSCLFLFDGLSRSHQENVESTEWPSVQAKLINCYVQEYYSVVRQRGDFYRTVCKFQYTVNDGLLESQTRTTSTKSQDMVHRMEGWIKHHPNGSQQTIHYNPVQPREISLAGMDSEIQSSTAAGQLAAAKVLAVVGLIFLAIALLTKKNGHATGSSTATLSSQRTQ